MTAFRGARAALCALSVSFPAGTAGGQAVPGDLFVSQYDAGSVLNLRDGGDFSAAAPFATGLSGPRGLCVGPDGDVFVAEADAGEVTIITQGGDFTGLASFADGLATPTDLWCDDEQVLVLEAGEGTGEITDVTAGGDFAGAPAFAAGFGDQGTALLRTAEGELFATDALLGNVFDVTAGGVYLSVAPFASSGTASGGLAQWGETLLVTDAGAGGQVRDFTLGGDLQAAPIFATLPGVTSLLGVPDLGVFAASDAGDAVHEISAGGDFTGAPPFATGVQVSGHAGLTHVRGCGDGILEGEEACDDGNLLNGDGCDDQCRVRLCLTPPAPDCVQAAKASFSYTSKKEGKEKLKLTLKKLGEVVTQDDFGAPTFDTSRWDICIYDAGGDPVGQLFVNRGFQLCGPKEETCWKALGDKGYRYKDKDASASGVRQIKAIGAPKPGRGKLQVQAGNRQKKKQNRMPRGIARDLEGESQATVRVMVSDGRCYGATLSVIKKNEEHVFKARTP